MIGHFVKRDFLDHRLAWAALAIMTALCFGGLRLAGTYFLVREIARQTLLLTYIMFGVTSSQSVLGSAWRTQYQLSRHYLLALPIPHRRLFIIQQVRVVVFWLPIVIGGGLWPLVGALNFTLAEWLLYYLGIVTSVGLLIQGMFWTTLESERIMSYVPKGKRLLVWAKLMAVSFGVVFGLMLAWVDLVFLRWLLRDHPALAPLTREAFAPFHSLPSEVVFPVGFLLLIFSTRHNARRWCVTL